MTNFIRIRLLVATGVAVLSLAMAPAQAATPSNQEFTGTQKTIEGLVRDIACPIQNKASTSKNFSLDCAIQCARLGSPLAILTDDGTMYIPISSKMPDTDQRQRLMPFIGKYVRATGVVYERKGTQAIVLSSIQEDKSVPVKSDAFPK